jgi:hypothetical protein
MFGSGLVSPSEVQYVVTVPAVWSPGAKQLMREAAKKAGLFDKVESQLTLALESEAASLCCRERELNLSAAQWKPVRSLLLPRLCAVSRGSDFVVMILGYQGMKYMVLDLGG